MQTASFSIVRAPHAIWPVRRSDTFLVVLCGLLFTATAMLTILWCRAMPNMSLPMPGGWTMSMTWMRMDGESWPSAAVAFIGMWTVMMVAMMLPSLAPILGNYRQRLSNVPQTQVNLLTILFMAGYFLVWTAAGLTVFPAGAMLASLEMREPAVARVVPLVSGAVVLLAGALQFTRWKQHRLVCCQPQNKTHAPRGTHAVGALKQGLGLGIDCILCCSGIVAILLALGVMDLRVMAVVTAATTAERLAPAGRRVARSIGVFACSAGLVLMFRAVTGG